MRTRMYRTGSDTRQQGMTLLELLVVLVIASLMLALVAPNVGNVLPGSELKAFARQSAGLLRELRSEAVVQSRIRRLALDREGRLYRSGDRTPARWPDGVEVQLDGGDVPDFYRDPFLTEPALLFFPDGSSNGGTLTLSRVGTGHYTVAVDALSGRVSIDDR